MPTLAGAEVTVPQIRGTIKLLDYYRRFLKSECGRCVDAEDRHRTGSTMTKEQVRRRLSFLVLTAINRKAGIPDPDNDIELWRDCQLVQHVAVHRCCCGYPRHSQGKEPCAKSRKRLLWRLITVIPLTARLNGFGRESAAMTPRLFRPRAGVG